MIFQPAMIVAVPIVGPLRHVGIISEPFGAFGPLVISSSRRRNCVAEEPLDAFANGGRVIAVGYPGHLPPDVVVARARSKLGERWNLFNANCEHFVSWAHGMKVESPSLKVALAGVALLVLGGFSLKT